MVHIECKQGKGNHAKSSFGKSHLKISGIPNSEFEKDRTLCEKPVLNTSTKFEQRSYYANIKATIQAYRTAFVILIHAILHTYISPITTSLFVVVEVIFVFSSINRWLSFTISFESKRAFEICKILAGVLLVVFCSFKFIHFVLNKILKLIPMKALAKLTHDEILLVILPSVYTMSACAYFQNFKSNFWKSIHHFALFLLFAITW